MKILAKNHIAWHNGYVSRQDRNSLNNHKSGLVWFTGLPSSGKSTIAHFVEKELFSLGIHTYSLMATMCNTELNSNIGFSREVRIEEKTYEESSNSQNS